MQLIKQSNERFSLIGKTVNSKDLTLNQVAVILNTLMFEPQAIYEAIDAFDQHGTNVAEFGICGAFMYSTVLKESSI